MANESTRITGPYGSERVPVPNLPDNGALASGTSQVPQEINRVPLNDAAMQTDSRFASAASARQARADRLDASTLETVGAGILEWDTSRLIKRLGRPTFEDDTPIEKYDYLQHLNMNLTADQREWFLDVAKGQKSAQWAVQELQDQTLRREVLGDSPLTATVTAFADPLWLAVPPSIRVGQLTGKAGRLASGVASAGLAGAVTALGEGPVSTEEIVLSMAMNGAAGFALYTPGKGLAKADPHFPHEKLDNAIRKTADDVASHSREEPPILREEPPVVVKDEPPGPPKVEPPKVEPPALVGDVTAEQIESHLMWRSKSAPEKLPGGHTFRKYIEVVAELDGTIGKAAKLLMSSADPQVWDMPVRLSGNARENVKHAGFVTLRSDSSPFVILHEAVHVATIRPIQQWIAGAGDKLGPQTKAAVQRLDELHRKFRDEWEAERGRKVGRDSPDHVEYALKNMHEFAAQAVSSSAFQTWLAMRPGAAGKSMWREFVGIVADLLGIGKKGSALDDVLDAVDAVLTARDTKYLDAAGTFQAYAPPKVMNQATAAAQALKGVTKDAKSLGESIMWNMHKTLSNFSDAGKKVADLLLDNNMDLGKSSMESHRAVILDVLQQHQFEFEGQLRNAMANQGFGTFSMVNPMTSRKAYAKQRQIEREVQHEMFRREQLGNANQPITSAGVPKHITEMADALDASYKTALGELKRAGVDGADAIMERAGYLNRKWDVQQIDKAMRKLEELGMAPADARKAIDSLVATALRRANPRMDAKLSEQVGSSIIDRALRKGKFEDSAFNGNASEAVLAEMRDVLKSGGMSNADIERALDVLRVQTDEAGKAGMLKHRMDLDYNAKISVNGQDFSIMDLIDSRVATNLDQYNKQVATQAAFARMGLTKRSDITALRSELVSSLPIGSSQAKEAVALFDNIIAHMNGLPAGQAVNENFRLAQQFTRTVSLAMSGLWQLTEYATAMAKYGALKTLKYGVQELPGLRGMLAPDVGTADALRNILADHSSASMRMRPFITRYEDGFEMDTGSAFKLSLNTAGNMVPYANGMRYVHHHQARIVANLIVDRLDQASKGNVKAQAALAKYGVDATMMPKLAAEIKANGFKIDNWADDVWDNVRPALGKMMDESVLKGRMGDLPAFATFDQVGKFLFTYRTFVLNAHNKILAGGLARDGMSSVGLMLLYQLPLAMAAVQAQSVIQGKGVLSEQDMLKKSIGQMGGIGLFSEPFKWAMGESNAVGAPGLIAVDRGVKMTQGILQGDPGGAANAALSMIPVANANPFFNAMLKQTN